MQQENITSPWYILGSGAIGCLWACKFLERNIPCALLHRQSHSKSSEDSCETKAINILQCNNIEKSYAINSYSTPTLGKIDKLIVSTKSYQSIAALTPLSPFIADDAVILVLQNGMGQQQLIANLLPNRKIIAATTTQGALLKSPLSVIHTGLGNSFFGIYQFQGSTPAKTSPHMSNVNLNSDVIDSLTSIGMQQHDNIQQVLWHKLSINCAINPLTALLNCKNGELLSNKNHFKKLQLICKEIDKVLNTFDWAKNLPCTLTLVTDVAQKTAQNFSSMHQDTINKRKTEIMYINGFLQQLADKLEIKLPLNSQLIYDIQVLEQQY